MSAIQHIATDLGQGNKRLGKMQNAQNIPQLNRLIGNSWYPHDWVWEGHPDKAQAQTRMGRGFSNTKKSLKQFKYISQQAHANNFGIK